MADNTKVVTILTVTCVSELETTPHGVVAHVMEPMFTGNSLSFVQLDKHLADTMHARLRYAILKRLAEVQVQPEGYKAEAATNNGATKLGMN